MALTKDQWYQRLKSWVPSWVFTGEDESIVRAIFYGIAKMLESAGIEDDNLFNQTFIDTATTPYLDLIGSERSVIRDPGESDAAYRTRIKTGNTKTNLSKPDLIAIINQFLTVGTCTFIEDFEGTFYCSREYFCNRGDVVIDPIDDAFTVIVEDQLDLNILNSVVTAVNRNKAFGVVWRLVERYAAGEGLSLTEDGDLLVTEDGDELAGG